MAYSKTTWVDRAVQFFNRFTKSNESPTSVDLTQAPGTVTQAGTPFNATNLNKLEQGVFDAHVTADAAVKRAGDTMTGKLTIQSMAGNGAIALQIDGGGKDLQLATTAGYVGITNGAHLAWKFYYDNVGDVITALVPITYQGTVLPQLRSTNGYVEWNNAGTWQGVGGVKNVQRGTAAITAGTNVITNVTIASVNLSKSFVNISAISDDGTAATPYSVLVKALLTTATNLELKMGKVNTGQTTTVSWEVIESY